ncbi:MAG: DUF3987 domain-containing protein [Bacteroidaceae bacterium]|nr:DUF3987 domain-containing protein [Bacteroidaceae bacterium]
MLGLVREKQIGGEGQALPITSKKEFLEIVGQTAHREMVARVRNAKTKEEKDKWKNPKCQLSMHWCMAVEEAMKLTEVKKFVNQVFYDGDHLTDQGTTAEELKQKMIALQPETGQRYGDISLSTNGVHGVFPYHPEWGSYLENIEHWDKVFGVHHDEFCETPRKGCFIPNVEDIFILEDALFEDLQEVPYEQLVPPSQQKAQPEQQADITVAEATEEDLRKFDHCVEAAHLQADSLDEFGHRHDNLMDILNAGVCKFLNKEKLMACLAVRMPSFINTKDCNRILNKWYDDYEMDLRPRSKSEKDFIDSLHTESEEKPSVRNTIAPESPKKLPRVIELALEPFPNEFHQWLTLESLTLLGMLAMRFRTLYVDNREIAPNLFFSLIGESGSGKSFMNDMLNMFFKDTIIPHDDAEWDKASENQQQRSSKDKDKPKKYIPKLYIGESMSQASMQAIMKELGQDIMLLNYEEADGLFGMKKSAWSDISVLLRKGFDSAPKRKWVYSDETANGNVVMRCSVILTGTPKAVLRRLFDNTEDGLMRRFMVAMVKGKNEIKIPKLNPLSAEKQAEFDRLVCDLWNKTQAIEGTQRIALPKTTQLVVDWMEEHNILLQDGELTEGEADLTHRIGLFMMKASLALVALYGKETKEILDLVRWVGDFTYHQLCQLFAMRIQKDKETARELMNEKADKRQTVLPVLQAMPQVFSKQEFIEERKRQGQSTDVKKQLQRYCKKGLIVKMENGFYEKKQV